MAEKEEVTLGSVQETLLLPLWGRAVETQTNNPLLKDETAVTITKSISYNFETIAKNVNKLSMKSWIARSIFFDGIIKNFIAEYPEAVIVNIGCGLDTTFDRIDNGKVRWFDLDFPEVIELRQKYIKQSERRRFIAKSALDFSWFNDVPAKQNTLFMVAGVLYYFTNQEVKNLFLALQKNFGKSEIIFDYSSPKGVEIANKKVITSAGMGSSSFLTWGIENIKEIENWNKGIKVIKSIPMFHEFKKNFPLYKRIGMNISDMLKIMSLAHVML